MPRSYVIVRTRRIDPGAPCVVAEVHDQNVVSRGRFEGAEVLRGDEMAEDRELAGALEAWEAGDDSLLVQELDAVHRTIEAAFAASGRVAAAVASILGTACSAPEVDASERFPGQPANGPARSIARRSRRGGSGAATLHAVHRPGGTST